MRVKKELKDLGYEVGFDSVWDKIPTQRCVNRYKLERRALHHAMSTEHDIVFLAFHHSTSYLGTCDSEERGALLKNIRNKCNLLVWLDTADSTGTCLFDVMPYVNVYLKKQVLVDRERYCHPIYGGRTFCEYYHKMLNIADDVITARDYQPVEKKFLDKIRISWNVGLGDLYANSGLSLYIRPDSIVTPTFNSCDFSGKSLDVQYRGSGYSPIAGYPRSEAKRRLSKMRGITYPDVSRKIPKEEFVREGENSKCILSPFGWGEICGRDFEAIVYGACMIKQDMSHCETFPNVYHPYKTYVPLKWDFSDFEEVLSKVATDEYQEIAEQAQACYKYFYTQEGKMECARHIIKSITE